MLHQNSTLILISTTFLALCGAMAKLLSDIEHKKITKIAVIASGSFAIFAGAIVGLIASGFVTPDNNVTPWASAFAGILGWAGKVAFDRWANRTVDAVADKTSNIINAAPVNNDKK
jgi:ammonia channel protein AmtB